MSNLFHWDELNLLREETAAFMERARKQKPTRDELEDFCDFWEFMLCLIYAYGWTDTEEVVGPVPGMDGLDNITVNLEIDGETFRDRLIRDIENLDENHVNTLIDTEAHRDYNTGAYDAAQRSGKGPRKRWGTMLDEKVRDTHSYLEGVEVGLDDLFYTYTGESALYPGGFGTAEEDCNCRCYLTYILK